MKTRRARRPTVKAKTRSWKKGSLVDSPFCGMWIDRDDIVDEWTYARQLRHMLETRGDRLR